MPKEKSSPIDLLMKKRATSSCIFPPGDLTPTGLKNVCCLSSRYRRYCRSNHRLFTSSSLPMSEVVFFIVIVPYRCNRRGYCSFDVIIIVVRIYTVNDVLILGDRQCSLSSFSLLWLWSLSLYVITVLHTIIPKASAAQLMFQWRKFVRTLTLHSD